MSPTSTGVALVALLSLVLVRAPILFGDGYVVRTVLMLPFVFAFAWGGPVARRAAFSPPGWTVAAVGIYIALLILTVLRGSYAGSTGQSFTATLGNTAPLVVIACFGYRLMVSATTEEERWQRAVAVALSPAAFVAFNLLIMNVSLPFITLPDELASTATGTPARIFALLGFTVGRQPLPLGSGVNGGGAIAAAGMASAVILAFAGKSPPRLVTISASIVCLYAVLLADARSALFLSLSTIAFFVLRQWMRRRSGVAVVAILLPPMILAALGFLSSGGLAWFSRSGGSDLETGAGRVYIWNSVVDTIRRTDVSHLLLGWGADGQITSGASAQYAYFFAGQARSPTSFTAHNLVLQTMLDAGVIGIMALAAFVIAGVTGLARAASIRSTGPIQALQAIVLGLVFNGVSEALPSYLFIESAALAIFTVSVSLTMGAQPLVNPVSRLERGVARASVVRQARGRRPVGSRAF